MSKTPPETCQNCEFTLRCIAPVAIDDFLNGGNGIAKSHCVRCNLVLKIEVKSRPESITAWRVEKCRRMHADDLMVISAFRYSLGRASYVVGACVDWIITYWPKLQGNTRRLIVREIKEAFKKGAYGMEMDKKAWQMVLERADADAG